MHCHFLIIYTKLGNVDRRKRLFLFLNSRIKSDQSVHPAEIEPSILSFQCRLIIELITQQSILIGKDTYISILGIELDQSFIGAKPQISSIIFQYVVSYIVRQPVFDAESGKVVLRSLYLHIPPRSVENHIFPLLSCMMELTELELFFSLK